MPPTPSLLLHEYFGPDGQPVQVHLRCDGDELALEEGDERLALPKGALEAAFARYGMPLEDTAPEPLATLDLGQGRALWRFRFRPRVDVIARDYALLVVPGAEASCVLCTHLAAVLGHLGRRVAATSTA